MYLTIKMPCTSCWVTLHQSTFFCPCQILYNFIIIVNSINYFPQYFKQVFPSGFGCGKTCKKRCRSELANHGEEVFGYSLEIWRGPKHSVQEFISNIFNTISFSITESFNDPAVRLKSLHLHFLMAILTLSNIIFICNFFVLKKRILGNSSILMPQFWFAYFTVINRHLPQLVVWSILSTIYIWIGQLFWVFIFDYTNRCSSLTRSQYILQLTLFIFKKIWRCKHSIQYTTIIFLIILIFTPLVILIFFNMVPLFHFWNEYLFCWLSWVLCTFCGSKSISISSPLIVTPNSIIPSLLSLSLFSTSLTVSIQWLQPGWGSSGISSTLSIYGSGSSVLLSNRLYPLVSLSLFSSSLFASQFLSNAIPWSLNTFPWFTKYSAASRTL